VSLSNLTSRPVTAADTEHLDALRNKFSEDGRIDVPWGYAANGIGTVVVERDRKIIGATVATAAVIIDFLKDPSAVGTDIISSVLMGERTLTYMAQRNGIVAAYCAIPSHLTEYLAQVKRCGYSETFSNCVVLRRPLAKELL
jgi:hypothetical protein